MNQVVSVQANIPTEAASKGCVGKVKGNVQKYPSKYTFQRTVGRRAFRRSKTPAGEKEKPQRERDKQIDPGLVSLKH